MAESKNWADSIFNFVKEHWGEMFTLWHITKGNPPKDGDPEWAKTAANVMGVDVGGKNNPKDEAFLKWVKSQIGDDNDRPLLQAVMTKFTPYAFQLNHPDQWVRERGRDSFEGWRVTVCRMGEPHKYVAVTYVTNFTRGIKHKYVRTCREAGVAPWPFDETNVEHRIAMEVAFDYGIEQMRSEGTYVPTGAEAALIRRLKKYADQMGSAGVKLAEDTWRQLPAIGKFAWKVARTGWFAGGLVTKEGLRKAEKADRAFDRYATKLHKHRTSRRSWWGAYKQNREEGQDPKSSALNAPRVSRESREGSWKRLSYRIAHFCNILNWIR